jgi:hypothetical protein
MFKRPTRIRLLVTVKAYPAASVKYGEAVCVAGIRTDTEVPEWVRLYPVEYRDLPIDQRFAKYEEIAVDVTPRSDSRPESLRPDTATIEVLRKVPADKGWKVRRSLVEPLVVESMCAVLANQRVSGKSLGAFRPAQVTDVVAKPEGEWTAKQQDVLTRMSLLAQDKTTLERIPWRFHYRYSCDGACRGHDQTIIDWEVHQAYRRWRKTYGEQSAVDRVRHKWLDELCGPSKDTIFFVGNQHQHVASFLVLGVFWPPRTPSQNLDQLQLGF